MVKWMGEHCFDFRFSFFFHTIGYLLTIFIMKNMKKNLVLSRQYIFCRLCVFMVMYDDTGFRKKERLISLSFENVPDVNDEIIMWRGTYTIHLHYFNVSSRLELFFNNILYYYFPTWSAKISVVLSIMYTCVGSNQFSYWKPKCL